jgi:hypothetical protein
MRHGPGERPAGTGRLAMTSWRSPGRLSRDVEERSGAVSVRLSARLWLQWNRLVPPRRRSGFRNSAHFAPNGDRVRSLRSLPLAALGARIAFLGA